MTDSTVIPSCRWIGANIWYYIVQHSFETCCENTRYLAILCAKYKHILFKVLCKAKPRRVIGSSGAFAVYWQCGSGDYAPNCWLVLLCNSIRVVQYLKQEYKFDVTDDFLMCYTCIRFTLDCVMHTNWTSWFTIGSMLYQIFSLCFLQTALSDNRAWNSLEFSCHVFSVQIVSVTLASLVDFLNGADWATIPWFPSG